MGKNKKTISEAERRARFLERIFEIRRDQKRKEKKQDEQKKNGR